MDLLLQKGYTRVLFRGDLAQIEDVLESKDKLLKQRLDQLPTGDDALVLLLIDRFVARADDEENTKRIADSVQTAFQESDGEVMVDVLEGERAWYNNRFELDGIVFQEPSPALFNYNNPYGACPRCEGFSRTMGIDEDKVVPDPALSVYDGAVVPWRGERASEYLKHLLRNAHRVNFPVHTPYAELTAKERTMLWSGTAHFSGIDDYFSELEKKTYKIQNRVMLARYRGRTLCPKCRGGRLRVEATYVKISGRPITELVDLPIKDLHAYMTDLDLSETDAEIARRLLLEINNRLQSMLDLGLDYLTLNRLSNTLSGGESQRINLTRTLGSNLTASMYILDEPSVGLHPRDTERMIAVLRRLRDLGNTVLVVEHEEDVIAAADYLIDIGPRAGIHGGNLVFAGPYQDIYTKAADGLTAQYMTGAMEIPVPQTRRVLTNWLKVRGARMHNLKGFDCQIPLNALSVVTGVSGSGKTSLVKGIIYPALRRHFGEGSPVAPGAHLSIGGDLSMLSRIEMVNQSPIGKSSRSNPVTYVKAYDAIRNLLMRQQLAKVRGYTAANFSFNVDGGRCETCKGEGEQVVEMQFLADVRLVCEACNGKRFKREILEVRYNGKNVADILDLSVEEAVEFFAEESDVIKKMQPLLDVGLGYVQLGQSSNTLSGGEAQRVKLASFLTRERSTENILFIFDEPTTGLHFHDVGILLDALNAWWSAATPCWWWNITWR